ncbi:Adenylate kinase [hydrothermal vent metagenome]|uniref:Adenylate kinase n=1 Tax=hydrothermal vent metagenome TaxID=652676 RepID=A0A1W1CJT2_9ZZZZ
MSKKLILLIGAPGSGKTTDAKEIAKNHSNITSYSLGELLKDEIAKKTKTGKITNDYVSKGDLVPTAITIDTICNAVQKAPTDIVLIDGFPRKDKQMKIFADIVNDVNRVDLISVIEIRVSESVARERVLGKEATEEEIEIFNHQMAIYKETIEHIEEFYNHNKLLKVIDGEQDLSVVLEQIDNFLKEKIALDPA